MDNNRIAYYPGCSLHGMSKMYDLASRRVGERAGLCFVEVPGWTCCGATSAHTVRPELAAALNKRNLELAANTGSNVLAVPCAACYANLAVAGDATLAVFHLAELFAKSLVAEAIREQYRRKFSGLAVACYYGCLTVRPARLTQTKDAENPRFMETLLEPAGLQCLDWSHKSECCGASFSAGKPELAAVRTKEIIAQALDAGAEVIAAACPLCHTNLEMQLYGMGRNDIPVVFFSQLLGLAMGFSVKEMELHRLLSDFFPWEEKLLPGSSM